MERLLKKFKTAADMVPQPLLNKAARPTRVGVLYYGSTSPAMQEALDVLTAQGADLDALRIRAFPFSDSVRQFIDEHDKVFVVEQNRDAQLSGLLRLELEGQQIAKLHSVLHYNGLPLDARSVTDSIIAQEAGK
jgi:2-oxoglutarate ferredoxin oxidoreductase subunit alpha